jgi:hypothetical protein
MKIFFVASITSAICLSSTAVVSASDTSATFRLNRFGNCYVLYDGNRPAIRVDKYGPRLLATGSGCAQSFTAAPGVKFQMVKALVPDGDIARAFLVSSTDGKRKKIVIYKEEGNYKYKFHIQ